jgi:histidine triad (HIT) family protein
MSTDPDCLFCQIAAGQTLAQTVWEDDAVLAFRDINPQAPVHVLVIPRDHYRDFDALAAADSSVLQALMRGVTAVAEQEGVADGYRLVFNTGAQAGQSVFHVHGHVLGGRAMTWPPG